MLKSIKISKIKPETSYVAKNIIYFKKTDSTNTAAKNTPCENGTLFIADTQTNGRGRMGRQWASETCDGIYMSLALTPKSSDENINTITLVAGVGVCHSLKKLFGLPFQIKWPNDVVIDGKKVCGILTEALWENKSLSKVVVGIGINVNQKSFSDDLTLKATSLKMLTGKKQSREAIVTDFAEIFENYYNLYQAGGVNAILPMLKENCITLGKDICIIKDGVTITATATDINEKGELVIKKEDGTILEVNSGEVSVRGIYGYN